jgi:hypothetical protein
MNLNIRVLQAIDQGIDTLPKIMAYLDIKRSTISATATDLKRRELIWVAGKTSGAGSKPASRYALTGEGATKLKSALSPKQPTPRKGSSDLGNFVPEAGGVLMDWTPPTETEVGTICEKHSKRKGLWGCEACNLERKWKGYQRERGATPGRNAS